MNTLHFITPIPKSGLSQLVTKKRSIHSLVRFPFTQNEGGTISHGLATALINRHGRIEGIWRGNAWTPAEVTEAIKGGELICPPGSCVRVIEPL